MPSLGSELDWFEREREREERMTELLIEPGRTECHFERQREAWGSYGDGRWRDKWICAS
jgi:hypothetical protein